MAPARLSAQGESVEPTAAVLLIDADCVLCNRAAQFFIRHDPAARLRFAALGSPAATALLAAHHLPPPPAGTVALVLGGQLFVRSEATLRAIALLPAPWCWGRLGLLVPRPLRDGVYRLIARTRLALFGRTTACALLTPAERARFLADS